MFFKDNSVLFVDRPAFEVLSFLKDEPQDVVSNELTIPELVARYADLEAKVYCKHHPHVCSDSH